MDRTKYSHNLLQCMNCGRVCSLSEETLDVLDNYMYDRLLLLNKIHKCCNAPCHVWIMAVEDISKLVTTEVKK
jgi:hypothetical protein